MSKRNLLFSTTALTPILIVIGGGAAFAQAVSAPNATLGGFGGTAGGQGFGAAEGRWTAPLGPMTGGQIDAVAGVAGGQTFSQVAGHLFWRDPATSLVGVYGAWTQQYGASTFRIGPEVEFYNGPFTFSGVAGVKSGGGDNFFTQIKGNLYLSPNTKIFGGYVYENGSFATAGFEHLFPAGLSLFGEARTGQGYTAAWAGFRFYFGGMSGPGKSLMAREREDVAPLWLHVADKPVTVADTGSTSPSSTSPSSTSPDS